MNYEINFLILQSNTEGLTQIRKKVKKIIERNGGKITDELLYQKRKLAYEIKHERYGFYTVYRFDMEDTTNIQKLTTELNLEQGITRHLIVRSDELPKLQSIDKKENSSPSTPTPNKQNAEKIKKNILKELEKETESETEKKPLGKKIKEIKNNLTNKGNATSKKKTEKDDKKEEQETTKTIVKAEKDRKNAGSAKEKIEEKKAAEKKDEKQKKKISIDDLDKKLDEILDI